MKKGYLVVLILVFGVLFAAFACKPPKTSGDVASWVQAVGSIAAIVAAVLIASDQHRKSEARAIADTQTEVHNFLAGVREELCASMAAYMLQAGTALEQVPAGHPVQLWWLAPPEPFKVYNATVGLIGRVRDDELRRQIISTFVVVGGLLLTWTTHNRLFDEFEKADEATRQSIADATQLEALEMQSWAKEKALMEYGEQLRSHHSNATTLVKATIALIDNYLKLTARGAS